MLYPTCPTCQNCLADKQLLYETEMEKICNEKINENEKNKKKEKLLTSIGCIRVCCRMRMISYIDQIQLIV